ARLAVRARHADTSAFERIGRAKLAEIRYEPGLGVAAEHLDEPRDQRRRELGAARRHAAERTREIGRAARPVARGRRIARQSDVDTDADDREHAACVSRHGLDENATELAAVKNEV